jgi:hypothetical protein
VLWCNSIANHFCCGRKYEDTSECEEVTRPGTLSNAVVSGESECLPLQPVLQRENIDAGGAGSVAGKIGRGVGFDHRPSIPQEVELDL